MNLEWRAQLEAAGVDVGQALARRMGSEARLERPVGKTQVGPDSAGLSVDLARATV